MKFLAVLLASIAAIVQAVTVDDLVYDIQQMNMSLTSVTYMATYFRPGVISSVPPLLDLQNQVTVLESWMQKSIADFYHYGNFSTQDTLTLAPLILQLQTPITESLTAINKAKCRFDRAVLHRVSVSILIKENLESLRANFVCLVDTMTASFPEAYKPAVGTVKDQILASFDHTIKVVYRDTPLLS